MWRKEILRVGEKEAEKREKRILTNKGGVLVSQPIEERGENTGKRTKKKQQNLSKNLHKNSLYIRKEIELK